MASLQYLKGDATNPTGDGPKIIAHCCNDVGGWGRGFVLALNKRWSKPKDLYKLWYAKKKCYSLNPLDFENQPNHEIPFRLGQAQLVQVESDLWVANIIGQHGTAAMSGRPPIRYDAIRSGLITVQQQAAGMGATVHMPRMGSGLAGGSWGNIESLVKDAVCKPGVAVCVYDL